MLTLRHFYRPLLAGLVFICFFLHTAAAAGQPLPRTGAERIISMDVLFDINEAGEAEVTEHIVLEAAGRNIKRGIVRVLPSIWTRQDGSSTPVFYDVKEVLRDGNEDGWRTERLKGSLELFIGRSSHMLRPGIYSYTIRYSVENAITAKDGMQSLYWNATGNDWAFTIEEASFRLVLPGAPATGPDMRVKELSYYTGRDGERGEDAAFLEGATIVTTAPLRPGEGLSISCLWPAKITPNVKSYEFKGGVAYAFIPALRDIYVLIPPFLLAAFYLRFARRWGREQKHFQVIPLFEPPVGMLPGDARFAVKGHYVSDSFAADILALVHKKYLFFAELGGMKLLSRYPEPGNPASMKGVEREAPRPGEELPPGGESFYARLFPKQAGAVRLDAPTPADAVNTVEGVRVAQGMSLGDSVTHFSRRYSAKRRQFFYPAGAVSIGGFILFLLASMLVWGVFKSADGAMALLLLCMVLLMPVMMMGVMLFAFMPRSGAGSRSCARLLFFVVIFAAIASVCATMLFQLLPLAKDIFDEAFGINSVWEGPAPSGGALAVLLGVVFSILAFKRLPRRTVAGQEVFAQAEGLKMYLKTAEKHRFEALYPPEENVKHFEELLPYAMALGVGETWANSFAKYCRAAKLEEVALRESEYVRHRNGIARSIARSAQRGRAQKSGSGRSGSFGGGSRGGGRSGRGAGGGGGRGW